MTIKIRFFGFIADKLGKHDLDISMQENMRLSDVLQFANCEAYRPFIVAINQQQVSDEQQLIRDGDEVAIMPPFSGG